MASRSVGGSRVAAILTSALLGTTACTTPSVNSGGRYVAPIGGAPVTSNPTPYSAALGCLANYAASRGLQPPHMAVGRISDQTGRLEDNGGRAVTQGAALMAMSALGRAGVPLVERYETDTPRLEFRLADNRLISDAPETEAGPGGERPYRPIMPGSLTGADYFLTGGITELNSNLRSTQVGATAGEQSPTPARSNANISGGYYVLNVAIDLRLVDMHTLDVVDMVSYQKQIVGRQVSAGVYAFFGNNVLNVSGATGGEEPIQFSIRSLIERGVLEMMGRRYGVDGPAMCLGPEADPLGDRVAGAQPSPVAYQPTYASRPAPPEPPPPPAVTNDARYEPEQTAEPPPPAAYPYRMLTWPSRQRAQGGQ